MNENKKLDVEVMESKHVALKHLTIELEIFAECPKCKYVSFIKGRAEVVNPNPPVEGKFEG